MFLPDTTPARCIRAGPSTGTSSPKKSESGCCRRNSHRPYVLAPEPGANRIGRRTISSYAPPCPSSTGSSSTSLRTFANTPTSGGNVALVQGYVGNNGFGIGASAGQATSGFWWRVVMARPPARRRGNGGEAGIRTLGRFAPSPVFETGPFDRSGTSPVFLLLVLYWSALASSSLTGCRFRRPRRCSSGTRRWSGSFAAAGAGGRWPRRRSSRPGLCVVPRCAGVRRDGAAVPLCGCPSD